MPIPAELTAYRDEDDFVQRFLIPLFRRLGFEIVANYHGKREFGKDLLVGEVDRFSHVRFHGIQAKFEPSVGKESAHELIRQCDEAFAKPFTHPQTGQVQRISSFYAVTAGSVSDEARDLFFESLQPRHADNVRLLDGKTLLALDRLAVIGRVESVRDSLLGLLHELRFTSTALRIARPLLELIPEGDGQGVSYPSVRLRANAAAAYLVRPAGLARLSIAEVERYWSHCQAFNLALDQATASPLQTVVSIKQPAIRALQHAPHIQRSIESLSAEVEAALAELGALAAL
jgi:hypothetical protein